MKLFSFFTIPAVGALMAGAVVGAGAAPLTITGQSVADAAAQISDHYGINLVLKGDFAQVKPLSMSFADADAPDMRLGVINDFANAIGADFTKTYVVSAIPADQPAPDVKVDTNATVFFRDVNTSAADAIATVAAVDNASAQISGDIPLMVTMPAHNMTAAAAANELAKQTHTRWKVFYGLTPRGQGHTLGGRVIGHTNGGSPITELPYVHFTDPAREAAQARLEQQQAAAAQAAAAQAAQQQAAADQQAARAAASGMAPAPAATPYGGYGYNGYGYDGGGYDGTGGYDFGNPYGYDGTGGYGGYGDPSGFYNGGSGLVIGNGSPYANGPIVFGGVGY